MISNVTNFNKNTFEFIVKLDDTEVRKKIDFTSIESLDLLKFYDWIMSSEENVFTRLSIVREIIINKNSFVLDDSDLNSAKSAFNRIIKEEIDKYFEQVNILKNDFLLLSERKQESYNSLHLKFLGWCSAIAIFIYDSLKDQPNEHLFYKIFLLSNEKINLFLSIFIVSLIIIWIIFIKEMNDYSNEHSKIKEFYTKQLFFEDKDFQNYLPEPIIPALYINTFICILIILLIRLFLIN